MVVPITSRFGKRQDKKECGNGSACGGGGPGAGAEDQGGSVDLAENCHW